MITADEEDTTLQRPEHAMVSVFFVKHFATFVVKYAYNRFSLKDVTGELRLSLHIQYSYAQQ